MNNYMIFLLHLSYRDRASDTGVVPAPNADHYSTGNTDIQKHVQEDYS